LKHRVETIGDATRIYALCEYPSWEPRYVGKTIQHIHERHKAHIRAAKRGGRLPVHFWLRKKIAGREWLAIKLIERVPAGDDWAGRERHWITAFRASGFRILNLTNGGEGLSGHTFTDEHKSRIAAALRTGASFNCLKCGTPFWRKLRDIKKGHNKFCSRSCANRRTS